MKFTKMQGAGNDYLFVDCIAADAPNRPDKLARVISDRRFGVGADGLILIRPSQDADARMQMFNADGSEAEMCGNGIRCVAKFVFDRGYVSKPNLSIETLAGVLPISVEVKNGLATRVRVNMGQPIFEAHQIPTTLPADPVVNHPVSIGDRTFEVTCVSMGNPHCVIFVEQITDELVHGYGPKIECHDAFPARVNVEFVEVISQDEVRQRTWERGSGETWACGTGASAVCAAGVITGRTNRKLLNHLLGGDLELDWPHDDGPMWMTGPAVEVFSGEFAWDSQSSP